MLVGNFPKKATYDIMQQIAEEQGIPIAHVKEALELRGQFMKQEFLNKRSYRMKYLGLFKPKFHRLYERNSKQK